MIKIKRKRAGFRQNSNFGIGDLVDLLARIHPSYRARSSAAKLSQGFALRLKFVSMRTRVDARDVRRPAWGSRGEWPDGIKYFVKTQNIRHFRTLLKTETHPDKRSILLQLLMDELTKFPNHRGAPS